MVYEPVQRDERKDGIRITNTQLLGIMGCLLLMGTEEFSLRGGMHVTRWSNAGVVASSKTTPEFEQKVRGLFIMNLAPTDEAWLQTVGFSGGQMLNERGAAVAARQVIHDSWISEAYYISPLVTNVINDTNLHQKQCRE